MSDKPDLTPIESEILEGLREFREWVSGKGERLRVTTVEVDSDGGVKHLSTHFQSLRELKAIGSAPDAGRN